MKKSTALLGFVGYIAAYLGFIGQDIFILSIGMFTVITSQLWAIYEK